MKQTKHQVFAGSSNFYRKKKRKSLVSQNLMVGVIAIALLTIGVAYGLFQRYIIKELPDVSQLEDVIFSEATVIADRNGKQLYKLYQENREYVSLEDMSDHMVNGIIAVEDQKFWTNKGYDLKGILRASINNIFNRGQMQGASTITQQLVKNLLLSSERTYTRKLKELVLTQKLHTLIKNDIKKEYNNLSKEETIIKMKEKILEMYLNYIFLGQNTYGVQSASRTYFNTTAKELTPLQASVLASLPKSPSKLNPYKNKGLLMGELHVKKNGQAVQVPDGLIEQVVKRVENNLKNLNFDKKDSTSFVNVIRGLTDFTISSNGVTYQITYEPGRKDFSLMNMYDEGYIDQVVLKKSFVQGLNYQFEEGKIEINAPHFVHRIQELLADQYDEEALMKGGLVVKTSLDRQIQERAEAAVTKNYKNLQGYGANNAGLIYLNTNNGDILAYVGSANYFDEEIEGKVDMVRALRQPGSSIKPFVYALAFEKLGLTLDTPIFDLPMTIAGKKPNNVDGRFMGLQPLRKALGYSRNIAPIKLFLSVGGEKTLKPYLKALGLKSLSDGVSYGYPLSIGAGEIQMIELANAYMHLATAGQPALINPILEIRTNDGSIVYQKQTKKQKRVIPAGVASLVWSVLSNRENIPGGWYNAFTIAGLKTAVKSGTTDVKVKKSGGGTATLPRDGRLAVYNPARVAIFWAGNTKGEPLEQSAYGSRLNSPIRKDFFTIMKNNNYIANETFPLAEMRDVTVNKYSGRIATDATPGVFKQATKGFAHKLPSADNRDEYGSRIKIDTLCNGKRSAAVPPNESADAFVVRPLSIMPDNRDIEKIKEWIQAETGYSLFLEEPSVVCEDRLGEEDDNITIEIIKPTASANISKMFETRYNITGSRPIKYVRIYLNDILVGEKNYREANITDIKQIAGYAGFEPGEHLLTIEAVDESGFFNKASVSLNISNADTKSPYLLKDKVRAERQENGDYKIYILFADDESVVKGGSVSVGGQVTNFDGNLTMVTVNPIGTPSISYTIRDIYNNEYTETIATKELIE